MRQLTHGSLFAGIGGFDLGFERAGFKTVWQVEKEPFCIAVLKRHFPNAERYYDVLKCGHDKIHKLRAVDVLTAGFPCQDLSVAGKRAGLEGSRSGLFWEVVRILGELRPAWFVLENVPGLFSSGEGRDFAIVLNALDELGYGVAWRVLNSQFFGVAQRRRRVFIVGCLGKPCPQEVLFEPESCGWDSEAGEEARTITSGQVAASLGGAGRSGGYQPNAEQAAGGHLVAAPLAAPLTSGSGVTSNRPGRRCEDDFNLAVAISASAGHHGYSSPRGDGSDNLIVKRRGGFGFSAYADGTCPTLESTGGSHQGGSELTPMVVNCLAPVGGGPDDNDAQAGHLVCGAIDAKSRGRGYSIDEAAGGRLISAPPDSDGVRDFTELPAGMDSARYRALGNAVTASVAQWIAERILETDHVPAEKRIL